ncbi:uncharacterized protein M421DRAFT_66076 [Didymella exigua CBS 183.55]|uniref:Uncharacterized protein n=1 Tax=Didymella exigua CBS 183.55 TaxID=1150837 RepID=A0A6A5RIE0_9PLEO|nr:uncharacterized protein M421DRAFT_66076 [Didymella exigua CBS 183.55]KAF1927243.1 hypothetical protein M421DRAFT_66076 [Didymella exigua CBS 183.55]
MDPPSLPLSPTKLAMSPSMPAFPTSPGRTKTSLGDSVVLSPSATRRGSRSGSPLREGSPLRSSHRRTDSEVSVAGLATMFETLEVKDPREARDRYMALLAKEKAKFDKIEKEYNMSASRKELRIEELKNELKTTKEELDIAVSRDVFERERKAHKANVAKWEKVFKEREEAWKVSNAKLSELDYNNKHLEAKNREYKKRYMEKDKELLRKSGQVPTLQAKIQGLERNIKRAESDVRFKTEEAAKYQGQLYSMEVELEGITAHLGEEILTLKDRLKLVESERDALKTSLKEEEVLRIAAEGQLALPAATNDEEDDFRSPVRSPRKPRTIRHNDEDKENQSPRKSAVDLRFLQQELAAERRYRSRAEDQIEFMKMECQFQCCSCRIAENKSKAYIHDDRYAAQMEAIKASVPALTPPASDNGEDAMDVVKDEPSAERPYTPPPEEQTSEHTVVVQPQNEELDSVVAFSPTTGTFKSIPSPLKALPKRSVSRQSGRDSTRSTTRYSDARSQLVCLDAAFEYGPVSAPAFHQTEERSRSADIAIHEDESDEDMEPPAPVALGPGTPYVTKTTTTTIPIAFSPATPAPRPGKQLMSPFTIGHGAANGRTPVLGELQLNNVPFDREAALQAIRERRGRARSMAEGHGTPMKQMLEGTKERRDISAPVSRVGRSQSRGRF